MSEEPTTAALIGVAVVGAGMSAMSSIQGGNQQAGVAMTNARAQARDTELQAREFDRAAQEAQIGASAEREATAYDVERQREQGTAFQAQQRAEVAGAGLEASGSPLEVMSETARQLALDRAAIQHAGETRARAIEDEGRMARYHAELARKNIPIQLGMGRYQASLARRAGTMGAATSVLRGASSALGAYQYGGSPTSKT